MSSEAAHEAIPPGTLDMLILQTLARDGKLHGFEIAESIQERSGSVLQVEEGSLYPALQRLLLNGWVKGEWGESENKRRAKYYRLTAAGKRQLQAEKDKWKRLTEVIAGVLDSAAEKPRIRWRACGRSSMR